MIYQLISEDLTQLGGAMGTERVTTNFRKFFATEAKAKAFAEKDYKEARPNLKIKWRDNKANNKKNGITSGDLSFVMYTIKPVKVES